MAALPGVLAAFLARQVQQAAAMTHGRGGAIDTSGHASSSKPVVGVGMVPRGEVGLVFAGVGSGIGAIAGEMFAVVVFMSVATTLVAPSALVQLYRGQEPGARPSDTGL